MRLIVMIPAYNEADTIGNVIKSIPRKIDGVQDVKVLVIEDGSTDKTVEVAKDAGADIIVSQRQRMGLGRAFDRGLVVALERGADVIVNIDADGQYDPREIPKLIQPILNGEADIVLGNRQIDKLTHMSFSRKIGNKIATFVTNKLSGLNISDAQTGFRAFSRRAALMLNVLSDYTYTQETLIQAAYKKLRIVEVPIEFRERKGKSRLISSLLSYAMRAGLTILLTYLNYKPLKTFSIIGLVTFTMGLLLGFRVLVHFYKTGTISPYIPTTIIAAMLIIAGFQAIQIGLFAYMVKSNRELIEKVLYKIKVMRESSQ
jgi:glycosyltransferase involved in cell wall biosynthesis